MKLRTVTISIGKSAISKITIRKHELLGIFQQQREHPGNKHILGELCELSCGMLGVLSDTPGRKLGLNKGWGCFCAGSVHASQGPGVSEFGSR